MATLGRRSLNGRPRFAVKASGAPPALSGVIWQQNMPIDPNAADATVVGYLRPVGGIGPFTYSISGNAGYSLVDGSSGQVRVLYYAPNSQGSTFQAIVTDARGVPSAPITVTVLLAGSSPVTTLNEPNPCNNAAADGYNVGPLFRLYEGGATVSVIDQATGIASTKWREDYDYLRWIGGGAATAGIYPLTINRTGAPPLSVSLVVQDYAPITFIELVPTAVSTSMLANAPVGQARATTPNNTPTFSINDPSGIFQITSAGALSTAKQPAAAGPIAFSITVADGRASLTQSFTITVVSGTTLPAANMTLTVPSSLANDTYNNTIGTPAVSGVTGTKSWSLVSQSGYNAVAAASGAPARYAINASTGAITAATILSGDLDGSSSATDVLTVSCTDGINTCTQSFSVPVAWAAISKAIHVGRGKSTATGLAGPNAVGVETMAQARAMCMAPHSGTYHVLVYADTDPDYYTNDNGTKTTDYSLRFPWQGPIIIEGVAASGVAMPRLGGPAALNASGGTDMRGKGFIVSGDGDMVIKNLEISGCHDAYSDGIHGVEAIRKDGQVAGNLTVQNCWLHDNDNNLLTAFGQQQCLIQNCLLENGGTSHVSSGACHNAYLGEMTRAIFRNNVSRRVNLGHLLKSRAMETQVYGNRFYDGLTGSASACVELPYAGQATIYNNVIEKGAMPFGPDTIRYGAEGFPWATNTLDVHSNTISVLSPSGNHIGSPSAIGFFYGASPTGTPATATVANNSLWLASGANKFNLYGTSNTTVADTGTTMLSAPPVIDQTRPDLGTGTTSPGIMYRWQGQDDYTNGPGGSGGPIQAGVQQLADRMQARVSASAAVGTTVMTVLASNDLGAGAANPFGAGTTWAISTVGTFYGATPWAAGGKYAVTANSDGSAVLKVAGALSAGLDFLQLLATAPGGTQALIRYPIVVT